MIKVMTKRVWWKLLLGLLLVLWPLLTKWLMPEVTYYDYMASLIMIYVCVALGLCILVGFTGMVSLGQAGFLAVGAYTAGLLTTRGGFDLLPALLIAGALCGILGFFLGLAAVRLKSTYLILVTMGFGVSVPHLLVMWKSMTGGHDGMVVDSPTFLGFDLSGPKMFYYIVLLCTAVMWLIARNITGGKVGRAFRAIRDSEIAAQAMGINLLVTRAASFSLSAIYAGIAGGLYAHLLGYLGPLDYGILNSLNYLIMVIVGGAASLYGAIIGAVFLTTITELFARAPAGLMLVFIGVTIMVVMLVLPRGLISLPEVVRGWRRKKKGGGHGTS